MLVPNEASQPTVSASPASEGDGNMQIDGGYAYDEQEKEILKQPQTGQQKGNTGSQGAKSREAKLLPNQWQKSRTSGPLLDGTQLSILATEYGPCTFSCVLAFDGPQSQTLKPSSNTR